MREVGHLVDRLERARGAVQRGGAPPLAAHHLAGPLRQLGEAGADAGAGTFRGLALATMSIGVAQGLGRLERPCTDEKQLFRRADRMQYLAKDAGGNRAVVMAEDLQVPLTHAEFREYLEYRGGAGRDPRSFPTVLLAAGRPLAHGSYPFEQYLSESANSG